MRGPYAPLDPAIEEERGDEMARQRRQASQGGSAATSSAEFACPECGKTFTRAASLGAHRQRAHGVAGTSKKTAGRRRRSGGVSSSGRSRSGPGSRASATAVTSSGRQGRDGQTAVNRDRLLQTLFPDGVPPREDVIRRLGDWLDEAERLTKV
jgi:uncharacterized C2H2 Zn-finger protein